MKKEMKKITSTILMAGLMLMSVLIVASQSTVCVEKQQVNPVGTATINGRVVNLLGYGVPLAYVCAQGMIGQELRMFHTASNLHGYFSLNVDTEEGGTQYLVNAQLSAPPVRRSQDEIITVMPGGSYEIPNLIITLWGIHSQSTPQSSPSPQNQQSSPSVQQNTQLLQNIIVRQQTTSR